MIAKMGRTSREGADVHKSRPELQRIKIDMIERPTAPRMKRSGQFSAGS